MSGAHPTSNRMLLSGFIMLGVALIVAIVLMVVMFIILLNQSASQTQLRSVQAAQELALLEGCQRLNVLRRTSNSSAYGDYTVFSFVQHFSVPPKTETAAQRKITDEFNAGLSRAVASKTWTPVTNCAQAVNLRGARYRPPPPIPFSKRLPPASALLPTP